MRAGIRSNSYGGKIGTPANTEGQNGDEEGGVPFSVGQVGASS